MSVRFSSVKSFHTVVWWVPRTSSCRSRFLYFFLVFSPLPSPVKISFTGFFFFLTTDPLSVLCTRFVDTSEKTPVTPAFLPAPSLLFCCCSFAQSHPTLCYCMDCSMPGFPVLHDIPEFAQTNVHHKMRILVSDVPVNTGLPRGPSSPWVSEALGVFGASTA